MITPKSRRVAFYPAQKRFQCKGLLLLAGAALLGTTAADGAVPAAPTTLIAKTISSTQINLTWQDKATNESAYQIQRRKVKTEFWQVIVTLPANTTSYSNTGLTPGTRYMYRVQCANTDGFSPFANNASAFTSGGTPATSPGLMFGVNLAGGEFGTTPGTYNVDYTYPTTGSEWDYYNGKGLKLIRIPFKWERIQPTLNGALNATEMGRIDSVIALARARGMKVILDMHNYNRRKISTTNYLIGSTQVPNSAFKNVWSQIASRYKNETALYAYGLMNEPHDTGGTWPVTAQEGVNGIRAQDTTHYITVAGDGWSGAHRWDTANPDILSVDDPQNKLLYEAHCYFDDDASGTYNENYAGEGATANTGVDRVKVFTDWLARNNNRKGLIGEYGVPYNVDSALWNTVLRNFLTHIKSKGVSGTYWAGGPWWGDNYALGCEPYPITDPDKPQMSVLKDFL